MRKSIIKRPHLPFLAQLLPPPRAGTAQPPVRPGALARMLALELHIFALRPLVILEGDREAGSEDDDAAGTGENTQQRRRQHQEHAQHE